MNTTATRPNRFSTNRFEFSHGKKPRGRGTWAFELGSSDLDQLFWASPNLTLAEAKREALAEARRRGYTGTIEVAS